MWEANNVWLIFALVVLWTGFPQAFASIMSTLFVPLSLAAAGIVLRGSGFVFHKATRALTGRRLFGVVFALSSIMTPFFLGASFGAIASRQGPGRLVARADVDPGRRAGGGVRGVPGGGVPGRSTRAGRSTTGWRAISGGARSAAASPPGSSPSSACSSFAATRRSCSTASCARASRSSSSRAICGIATIVLLARRATRGTRVLAAGAVVALLAGWGVAQYPYLLPGSLTIADAAGAPRTLSWLFVVFLIAGVTVVPALVLLFVLDQRSRLQEARPSWPVRSGRRATGS